MRLIIGAPVAHREWVLPAWFQCLSQQSRQPDRLVFVHGGEVGDATWLTLRDEASRYGYSTHIQHDISPTHERADNARFLTLARLRNELLNTAQVEDADLFLSLDTDILLRDPDTILKLEQMVLSGDCDLATAVTFFHPGAPARWTPDDKVCWAYNLAFIPPGAQPNPQAPWARPHPSELPWGQRIKIDIPMGVWLANRAVLKCRYAEHEGGEDIAFGYDLRRHNLVSLADTSLYAQHVWGPEYLEVAA